MLQYSILFLILAFVAAVFGFGGIMAVAIDIARILFVVFVVLFIATAVMHVIRGKVPTL